MKQAHILLIEDTDSVREVLSRQLDVLGARVVALCDGQGVEDILRQTEFDLVITDLELPDCKGTDIARLAKLYGRKVILLSGDGNLSGRADIVAAGFDDVLTKPVALTDLQRLLKSFPLAVVQSDADLLIDESGAIDMYALRDQMGDLDEFALQMIAKFPDMMRPLVQKISEHVANKNLHELVEVVHSLKGAARSAGAMQLGAICEQVQNRAQGGQLDYDAVQSLQGEFLRVEAAIHNICV